MYISADSAAIANSMNTILQVGKSGQKSVAANAERKDVILLEALGFR